jgi:hypothetical protein
MSASGGNRALKSLTFEAGSNLTAFEKGRASKLSSLESISVPASVEVLRKKCFASCVHLSSLTFDPGSKLREIEDSAFAKCRSLKSISLPPSLAVMSGVSFSDSSIERVVLIESNPHYFVSGDFLIAVEGIRLIRYLGHSENVTIGREVEGLGEYCFGRCKSLVTVAFESNSRLTIFGESAFSHCSALKMIWIPAQVETISEYCFDQCYSLAEVRFEPGSKLTRIDLGAFMDCPALTSFFIPAHVEILESGIFPDGGSISELKFENPSRLKHLHLPMDDFASLCIPDSVEVLEGLLRPCQGSNRLLKFGRESQITRMHLHHPSGSFYLWRNPAVAVFVCLSEGTMRRFRSTFEAF